MSTLWLILQFLAGFVFLVGGAEFLVRGGSRLAARYRVPEAVIGLTIVAFGTSLPELVVSLTANLSGSGSDIAIGNVVGSNIANLGLILGLAGLVRVLDVKAVFPKREIPVLIGVTIIFTLFAWLGGSISRIEGVLLCAGLLIFLFYSYRSAMSERAYKRDLEETLIVAATIDDRIAQPSEQPWFDAFSILMGLAALVLGANWLVTAAEQIAMALGVPELIIGLTLVAIGTSLPEVATSLVAVFRGNGDIAVGNVVGSNLFNILGIVGITAMVSPLAVPASMLSSDFLVMLGLTVLVYFMVWRSPHDINRWKASILLGCYVLYCGLLFFRTV